MSTPITRLDAMSSLAEVDLDQLPLGVNSIELNEDGVPSIAHPPKPSRLRFVIKGIPFYAAVSPADGVPVCQVWAEVGHLPYTAQSPAKRAAILAVLQGTNGLPNARFVVQGGQKIILFSEWRGEDRITPEDIVYQTTTLMQEARPFLRLLGEHL
jgi:hypothetical protein